MKPFTISRKKSGANVSPLFNMLCSALNPAFPAIWQEVAPGAEIKNNAGDFYQT
jgi:hypothetical protein